MALLAGNQQSGRGMEILVRIGCAKLAIRSVIHAIHIISSGIGIIAGGAKKRYQGVRDIRGTPYLGTIIGTYCS